MTEPSARLCRLIDEFDCRWRRGESPEIQSFLDEDGAQLGEEDRRAFLLEAIKLDLEYRQNLDDADCLDVLDQTDDSHVSSDSHVPANGSLEPRRVEDYLSRLPLQGLADSELVSLLTEEFRIRSESGEVVTVEEYADRFPGLVETLESELDRLSRELEQERTLEEAEQRRKENQRSTFAGAASDTATNVSIPVPGSWFGQYLILKLIGEGAMGLVYRARQKLPSREVALKVINAGAAASESHVQRFVKEADATAELRHPGIVPVYEAGECGALKFFSMEFVNGSNLEDFAKAKPLTFLEKAELISKVARAVHYAHQRGIVHRDIKPRNILIDEEQQPRITDFGLAKWISAADSPTIDGEVLGTPEYMPPEQAKGDIADVDRRSDVYSLGAVLYRLITGVPPFKGESVYKTIRMVVEDRLPRPKALEPAVPTELERITLRCLEKSQDRRYQNAQEIADDLDQFLAGEQIVAAGSRLPAALRQSVRRHPVAACLFSALGVAALGLGFFAIDVYVDRAVNRRLSDKLALAMDRIELQKDELARQHQQELQLRDGRLYRTQLQIVRKLIDLGQLSAASDELQLLVGRVKPNGSTTEWELTYLNSILSSRNAEFHVDSEPATALAVEPATGQIAAGNSREVSLFLDHELEPLDPIELPALIKQVRSIAWSPDGRRLAVCGNGQHVVVCNRAERKRHIFLEHESSASDGITFSNVLFATNDRLLTADTAGTVTEWGLSDTDGSAQATRTLDPGIQAIELRHEKVTGITRDGAVCVYDTSSKEEGKWECLFQSEPGIASTAALSNDGTVVASAGLNTFVRLQELKEGGRHFSLDGHRQPVVAIAWSSEGRVLASGDRSGTICLWDVRRRSKIHELRAHYSSINSLRFTSRDRRLLSVAADKKVASWNIAAVIDKTGFPTDHQAITRLSLCEKRRAIVTVGTTMADSENRAINLYRLDDLSTARKVGNHPAEVVQIAIDCSTGDIATLGEDGVVRLSTSPSFGGFHNCQVETDSRIRCIGFDSTGNLNCGTDDGTILVVAGRTDVVQETVAVHDASVCSLDFAPGSSRVVSCDRSGVVRCWDSKSKEILQTIDNVNEATQVRFLDDSHVVVTTDGGSVSVLDLATGSPVTLSEDGQPAKGLRAAPVNPSRLVTTGGDGTIRIWDRKSGLAVMELLNCQCPVADVVVSTTDGTIVAATADGSLYAWRIPSQ